MNNFDEGYLHKAIEALLFISEKPVMLDQLKEVLGASPSDIRSAVMDLKNQYDTQKRGMVIMEIAGGYQMLSNPEYVTSIRKFFKVRVKEKLTQPSLETLAIIAYKQPVTRAEVEVIRGVNSDGVVMHLSDKGLIKIVGRRDVPGRPFLYGTTKLFLEYFGLKSLSDLPKLDLLHVPGLETQFSEEEKSLAPAPAESSESLAEEDPAELKSAMENIDKERNENQEMEAEVMEQNVRTEPAESNESQELSR